ncbi:midcut-by-XrtH protein [Haliea sp. E17]|uniref:midcut-by-XrtH protein n=1 Tax=Haliea sp. E17 TaxID=3401576 RepID=UPI003AAE192E
MPTPAFITTMHAALRNRRLFTRAASVFATLFILPGEAFAQAAGTLSYAPSAAPSAAAVPLPGVVLIPLGFALMVLGLRVIHKRGTRQLLGALLMLGATSAMIPGVMYVQQAIAAGLLIELNNPGGATLDLPSGPAEYRNTSGIALTITSVAALPECSSNGPADECRAGMELADQASCSTDFSCASLVTAANDDAIALTNGGNAAIDVLANDSGEPPLQAISFGDSLANVGVFPADGVTLGAFPAPGGGTLDVSLNASGNLSVTANGTTGAGSVTLFYSMSSTVIAGDDTAQVLVTFGDLPTAVADTLATLGAGNEFSTDVGVTLNIGAGTGLLNNDTLGSPAAVLTQWGGGDASAGVDRNPGTSRPLAGGTMTVYADGAMDLVNPTVPGVFTFNYIIGNSVGSSQGSVEIYVNDPPVAEDDALTAVVSVVTNYAAATLFNNNGAGADYLGAPTATITSFGGGSLGGAVTDNAAGATVGIPGFGGALTVNADGSLSIDSPALNGSFTFQYLIDNGVGTDSATVTVSI